MLLQDEGQVKKEGGGCAQARHSATYVLFTRCSLDVCRQQTEDGQCMHARFRRA